MPPEGLEEARDAFANEIAPPTRPRDQAGRFVQTSRAPEPIFQPRAIEGDERGDTSDGGADPRLVEHERRLADGWATNERDESARRSGPQTRQGPRRPDAAADEEDYRAAQAEPERLRAPGAEGEDADERDEAAADAAQRRPADGSPERDAEGGDEQDAGPTYEVTVDGQPVEVSLQELQRSYAQSRGLTERAGRLAQVAQATDQQAAQAAAMRDQFVNRLAEIEQEWQAALPPEPDWDALFKSDPQSAHALQKNFQTIYGKINAVRQQRALAQQEAQADYERRTADYARQGFAEFVQRAKITNEKDLKYEIDSMRTTARNEGFNEGEIATVYDPRMLRILQKASKYDRMMATKPKPVVPGQGKAMSPGAAPRVGNSVRKTFDDAQRRLASTGKLEDAESVFARMLR